MLPRSSVWVSSTLSHGCGRFAWMLLVASVWILAQQCVAQGVTVQVATNQTLWSSLGNNSISTIVVAAPLLGIPQDTPHFRQHTIINRNVTVTGQQGLDTVLDLGFHRAMIHLCRSCTFTFSNITVLNERWGTGLFIDIFLGQPGHSRVVLSNVNRMRLSCLPPSYLLDAVAAQPRSSLIPGKQMVSLCNVTYQGISYPDSLFGADYSMDVERQAEEGRGFAGGYTLVLLNATRICQNTPCVSQQTDAALSAAAAGAAAAAAGSGLPRPALVAAIAVPVAVAGLLLLLAAVCLVRCHNLSKPQQMKVVKHASRSTDGSGASMGSCVDKQWQPGHLQASGASVTSLDPVITEKGSSKAAAAVVCATQDSVSSQRRMLVEQTAESVSRLQPRGGTAGWQLVTTCSAGPIAAYAGSLDVEFGKLLGAGSYGRVFAGRFAGWAVAVKVMEHDLHHAAAVKREAELMLAVSDPHLVRALFFVTFQHTDDDKGDEQQQQQQQNDASPRCRKLGSRKAASFSIYSNGSTSGGGGKQGAEGLVSSGGSITGRHSSVTSLRASSCSKLADIRHQSHGATSSSSSGGGSGGGCGGRVGSADSCSSSTAGTVPAFRPVNNMAESWLVQDYYDLGTLGQVAAAWMPDTEDDEQMLQRLLLLLDAARGLKALHKHNVVHGDLNVRNILVKGLAMAPYGRSAALADLGVSRVIKQQRSHHTTHTVGSMSHMPPEVLRSGRMSPAVDIYSFGIMMWELWTHQPAFKKLMYGQFFETVVVRNLRPMTPAGIPPDYCLLMEACWSTRPGDRPSVDRLIKCLELMIDDRQQRVLQYCHLGASSTLITAAGGAGSISSGAHEAGAMGTAPVHVMMADNDKYPAADTPAPVAGTVTRLQGWDGLETVPALLSILDNQTDSEGRGQTGLPQGPTMSSNSPATCQDDSSSGTAFCDAGMFTAAAAAGAAAAGGGGGAACEAPDPSDLRQLGSSAGQLQQQQHGGQNGGLRRKVCPAAPTATAACAPMDSPQLLVAAGCDTSSELLLQDVEERNKEDRSWHGFHQDQDSLIASLRAQQQTTPVLIASLDARQQLQQQQVKQEQFQQQVQQQQVQQQQQQQQQSLACDFVALDVADNDEWDLEPEETDLTELQSSRWVV